MKNLDAIRMKKASIMNDLAQAIKSGETDQIEASMKALAEYYEESITAVMEGSMQDIDRTILAGRGVRQLTSEESKFYQAVIKASMDDGNVAHNIANLDVAFPMSIIDTVMDDIRSEHPLLEAIDFQNTSMVTRLITDVSGAQKAVWGKINAAIVEELSGGIDNTDLTFLKLTAFMFMNNDMLEAGPEWADRYVRAILSDALALGMEDGIVNGSGKDEPIGMTKQEGLEADGTHKDLVPVVLTEITPETIGAIVADLAKGPGNKVRKVSGLIMVVNPFDYYSKVMPATTILCPDGTYRNDVLPVPCTIIQSAAVEEGKAAFGMGKRYFLGMGLPKNGKLEYDDSYKFLEDVRTYKIKFIGNGCPKDYKSFKLLDISGLKPLTYKVAQAETEETA